MTNSTDRIEKTILLRAPRSRVWQAVANAEEFGTWFLMKLAGPFVAGKPVRGEITHPAHAGFQFEIWVERIEAEHLFSYRWHPYAIDRAADYSKEPTTLVEFRLEDAPGGTRLSIVESGFDKLPPERRETSLRMNDQGWSEQIKNVERYVSARS